MSDDAPGTHPVRLWNAFWFAEVQPFALGVCRLLVCASGFAFLLSEPIWDPTSQLAVLPDLPADLWQPFPLAESLGLQPPTRAAVVGAYWATLLALCLATIGAWTRPACVVAAAGTLYLVALRSCWGKIFHDYHVLSVMLVLLALAPCGAALSVHAWRRKRAGQAPPQPSWQYGWPVKLLGFSYALMMFWAGYNKLAVSGMDWILSDNMRNMLLVQNLCETSSPPPSGRSSHPSPGCGSWARRPWSVPSCSCRSCSSRKARGSGCP